MPDPLALSLRTITAALRASGSVFAEREARLLVAHATSAADLRRALDARVAGSPLEHVVGWAEFMGHRVPVSPGVFVPRRRTALVAHLAIDALPHRGTLVDLCCGSGAIAVAAATQRPDATIIATDIDPLACACARRNLARPRARVYEGDMDQALPTKLRGAVDVVTACAPYVPTDQLSLLPREARLHEPWRALDGGPDGTAVQRRVAEAAVRLLSPTGVLVIETSDHLAVATLAQTRGAGLTSMVRRSSRLGATVVVATLGEATVEP